MKARASHVTAASPAGSESAQPQAPQVSAVSGSPQPVQLMSNQPARVPTPGTNLFVLWEQFYRLFSIYTIMLMV
jgi:hypothetical protein